MKHMTGKKSKKAPNDMKRTVCVLALAAAVILSGGCARQASFDIGNSEEAKQEYSEWEYDGGGYTSAREKSELVTAHVDASGSVKEIDDAVSLKGIKSDADADSSSQPAVRDASNLTDISNKDGDEVFDKKDNYIYFQNLGSDISYEGKGRAELPVSVNIKYTLDGEEMSPDKIKGRKGHAKVDFTFNNSELCNVEVGGVDRELHVPFTVISVVTMDDESCRNLELHDCKESSFNSESVIMAYTMPGLKSNLEAMAFDVADLDIPESFSFEFDTDEFSMGFSTSIVSSNLLDEEADLSELEDLKSSLSELGSAGKKLSDAGCDISSGMDKFKEHLEAYTGGVDSLDTGIAGLAEGMEALADGQNAITEGAQNLSEGMAAYDEAFNELKPMLDAMLEADPENEQVQALVQWYEAMAEQSGKLKDGSSEYASGIEEYAKGINQAADGANKLKSGSTNLASRSSSLVEGYDALAAGISEYSSGIEKFYKEGIAKLESEGTSKIIDVENLVRMLEKAGKEYKTYSGLDEDQDGSVTFIIETEEV